MEKAKLVWLDVSSGEGQVSLESTGELLYLHHSTIFGVNPANLSYPDTSDKALLANLRSGDMCRIRIYENIYARCVGFADFTPAGVI